MRPPALAAAAAALALTPIVPAGAAAAAAPTTLVGGPLAGGTWTLDGEHRGAQPIPVTCLHLSAAPSGGGSAGDAVACAGGVLHGLGDIMALTATFTIGGTPTRLLGGLTRSSARSVQVTLAGGRHQRVPTHAPPPGFGAELFAHVRYFAAPVAASPRRLAAYDRRRHRVGATAHIARPQVR